MRLEQRERGRIAISFWVTLLLSVGLIVWVVIGIIPEAGKKEGATEGRDVAVSPNTPTDRIFDVTEEVDLEEEQNRWLGLRVRIRGQVEEKMDPRLFWVDTDGALGESKALVAIPAGAPGLQGEDQTVTVVGTFQKVGREDLGKLTGIVMDPNLYMRVNEIAVVVAESLDSEVAE